MKSVAGWGLVAALAALGCRSTALTSDDQRTRPDATPVALADAGPSCPTDGGSSGWATISGTLSGPALNGTISSGAELDQTPAGCCTSRPASFRSHFPSTRRPGRAAPALSDGPASPRRPCFPIGAAIAYAAQGTSELPWRDVPGRGLVSDADLAGAVSGRRAVHPARNAGRELDRAGRRRRRRRQGVVRVLSRVAIRTAP
jgi:hypothetical protein